MSEPKNQSFVDDIYAEGDLDLLFFGFIAGYVSHDASDNSLEKSDEKIFDETEKLIEYLVATGDFIAGRMCETEDGVKFVPYKRGFSEFESSARQCMRESGLKCDELHWELALRKVGLGKAAPIIPETICKLFPPKN